MLLVCLRLISLWLVLLRLALLLALLLVLLLRQVLLLLSLLLLSLLLLSLLLLSLLLLLLLLFVLLVLLLRLVVLDAVEKCTSSSPFWVLLRTPFHRSRKAWGLRVGAKAHLRLGPWITHQTLVLSRVILRLHEKKRFSTEVGKVNRPRHILRRGVGWSGVA